MKRYAIGIDLGGTNIKGGVVDGDGSVVYRTSIATMGDEGRDVVLDRIAMLIDQVHEAAGLDWNVIAAIGIGSPGPLDPKRGLIVHAPNLPGWENLPLRDIMEKRFPVPVLVENDANAAAFGETWVGAGKGCTATILLTLGTGIGGGIVLNGKVWQGADGMGAELGHMTIDYQGRKCNCGSQGCIEAYASATAMVRRMREAIEAGEESSMKATIDDPEKFTAAGIHDAAVAGDALAARILDETGRLLGVAIASFINIFNPERVILSGGMTEAGEMLFGPMREEVARRAFDLSVEGCEIVKAALPADAGIIGAAAFALQQHASDD